jgi:hypothetical protein
MKKILMLVGVIALASCATWEPVTPTSMSLAQFVEEYRPERVKVTTQLAQWELEDPSVEGDELVGYVDESSFLCRALFGNYYEGRGTKDACENFVAHSVPIADIVTLEARKGETTTRVLMGVGVIAGYMVATIVN